MDEVHVCGILQSKNKPKKGYIEVSGVTYWCAEWTEPYVARQTIGDVVDIIYKVGKNGGKTLVSIRKARDPSKAVQVPAKEPEPFKTAAEIKQESAHVITPPAAAPQQQTTCTSPSPVAAPVAMWSSPATIDIEVIVNLDNYEMPRQCGRPAAGLSDPCGYRTD